MRAMPSPRRPDPVFRTRTPKEAFARDGRRRFGRGSRAARCPSCPASTSTTSAGASSSRGSRGSPSTTRPARRTRSWRRRRRARRRGRAPRARRARLRRRPQDPSLPRRHARRGLPGERRAPGDRRGASSRESVGAAPGRLPGGVDVRGHRGGLPGGPPGPRPGRRADARSSSRARSATCTRTRVPAFFGALAAAARPRRDGFLVGVDLVKDPARLHAAYNDAAGRHRGVQPQHPARRERGPRGGLRARRLRARGLLRPRRQWIEMRLRAREADAGARPARGRGDGLRARGTRSAPSCRASTRGSRSPPRLAGTGPPARALEHGPRGPLRARPPEARGDASSAAAELGAGARSDRLLRPARPDEACSSGRSRSASRCSSTSGHLPAFAWNHLGRGPARARRRSGRTSTRSSSGGSTRPATRRHGTRGRVAGALAAVLEYRDRVRGELTRRLVDDPAAWPRARPSSRWSSSTS